MLKEGRQSDKNVVFDCIRFLNGTLNFKWYTQNAER